MGTKELLSTINMNEFSNDEQKLIHSYIDNAAEIERVKLDLMANRIAFSGDYSTTEIELSIEQLNTKLASLKNTGDQLHNSITALILSRTNKNKSNSFNSNSTKPLTYEFSIETRTPEEINAKQIKIYEGIIVKANSVLDSARKNLKKMEEGLAQLEANKISLATSLDSNAYKEAEKKVADQKLVINKQRILIGDIIESIKESGIKIQSLKTTGELDVL